VTVAFARRAAAAVFGAVLLAVALSRAPDPTRVEVEHLLADYAAALRAEDWSAARDSHTSAAYRRTTSDVVFLTGQVRNRDAWGPVERFELVASEPEQHMEDGSRLLRFDVVRHGSEARASALFDVVEGEAGWRIRRTWWVHPPSPATERVF
jgi:hypothetical protein